MPKIFFCIFTVLTYFSSDGTLLSLNKLYLKGTVRRSIRNVKAVKLLMLPLPAPLEVLCLRVCFRFRSLSSKCFRFCIQKNLTASSFRFHIPVCNSCDWLSTKFHKRKVTLVGLLGSATCQHVLLP